MTYRKLFLVLFGTATFIVAGAAWVSHQTAYSVTVETPLVFTEARLDRSSISMITFLSDGREADVWFRREPTDWVEEPYKDIWKVGVERHPILHFHTGTSHYYLFHIPLWLIYLVFIALAYSACQLMEKRLGGGKEKALAEDESAGRLHDHTS